jgi:maltose O-acetyltransferase
MAVETRQLYSSANGDRWLLGRDPVTGDVFIRHEPNEPSGGQPSHVDIGEFLSRGPRNPEHHALLHLIGTLARPAEEAGKRPGPTASDACITRTEKEKMLAGELYDASAPELQADLAATHRWLARYNAALDMAPSERRKLLVERLAVVGDGAVIRPPFHCDYGFNIRLGAGVFLNFNCVILDVVEVSIGDRTQIGPGVQILAADHPRDAALRASGLEFGRPIHIGRNVWIGAGAIILPGVFVGNDALIGAGSVVTRDVPAGATAFGNPARVQASTAC